MLSKKQIRNEILKIRMELSAEAASKKSSIICERIRKTELFQNATDICLYMPVRNEVNVMLLKEYTKEKRVWLPKVEGDVIEFYLYDKETELAAGAYNIMEPVSEKRLNPDKHTLIIMPGAVFSKKGDRIGYGGGYYDKYLQKYPECHTIAACYDFQILDDIPHEEHDMKPERIISDKDMKILTSN